MENPFESGHIKNYLLLYASIVVIMVLFFIASTLFHNVQKIEKKQFNTTIKDKSLQIEKKEEKRNFGIKLMKTSY